MEQQGIQMDQEILCCSICLDLLKDPVTISCGHSYCMSCIKSHWDEEEQKRIYSCPQCRQAFRPRPVLVRNTMLADLVEELKKTGLQAAPADHCCYAEPGDVACDVCTGRKLKATKSCLQCLVSYCEQHLQPHYESAAFDKHKLVEPSKKLQENICSRHNEVMKIFCRSDQQSICYLCSMDEHKGHDTVPAAAERTEKQRELGESRQRIQKRIQDMERDVKVLQQEVKAVNISADKAVRDSEKIFTQLVRLIEKKSSDVRRQITSQQETEVSRIKDLQDKLQQEITELKRKDIELDQLSLTEDHTHFLHSYPSLSQLSTNLSIIDTRPLQYFEDVSAAVSDATDKLEDTLNDEWTKISLTVTNVDVLLPQAEPKTRDAFLKYSWEIKLDPNTAHKLMILSDGNGKATVNELSIPAVVKFAVTFAVKSLLEEPTRFDMRIQVLSQESLPGRCYWEVEWEGEVFVAVAYKDISRTEVESEFGHNDKSWSLHCANNSYEYRHDNIITSISGPQSSRVGVYLDHRAGILFFYSVSETMTLLHRVHTTFTQPLYAGLRLDYKSTAQLY